MANIYVRSTDGSNADNGSTWALAKADLTGAAAIDAAGDTIYLSQAHAESTASALSLTLAGTLASPTRIIGADDAAEPPTALGAASITTTGNAGILFTCAGYYIDNVVFNVGTGASSSASFTVSGATLFFARYSNCTINLLNSNTANRITLSQGGSGWSGRAEFENVTVKFSAAAQGISLSQVYFVWEGGGLAAGGTSPTAIIKVGSGSSGALLSGLDLSAASAGLHIFDVAGVGYGRFIIRNCKLPASWSGSVVSATPGNMSSRFEMHNCDGGDTNYRLRVEDYAGSIRDETVIVRTGGASDGTTALSWKLVTTANAEYPVILLLSPEGALWNDTTGSSKTLTVEIVHDSQGAGSGSKFQDDEVWLEVMALTTSGVPLGEWISDCKADVLATAANQSDSTETWTTTGLTTPVKQTLSVTFTPQEKGVIAWRVVCAKASKTLYVCPKAALT